MKRNKPFLLAVLVPVLALCSCYHEFPNGGGGGGGGATTANVSITMVSDTLPANIGIVSFIVTINSIQLTSSTGAQTTYAFNNGKGVTVDLARLQSDSAFLGTVPGVPTGTNSSITLSFAPNARLTFYNGTGAALTSPICPVGAVCVAPAITIVAAPVITSSQAISGNTGIGIDLNLANSLTVSGGKLSINLSNSGATNAVSAFALPRTGSNLAAGQLDLVEDFTGVVTLGSSGVTIASATAVGRGSIAAASSTNTNYDQDPTMSLCPAGTNSLSGCVTTNGAASMDAILNSDGTFTVQEIEPLMSALQDTVEGTVLAVTNATQFVILTTDIIPAGTNSKIGGLSLGDALTVNLAAGPAFWVDTKGLAVGAATGNFQGMTDTTALHLGQSVAVHVVSFTAANGNTLAIANGVDTVTLRWSRFIATVNTASTPEFGITGLPGYFGFTAASIFGIQTYAGTLGADGVTNLDGITTSGNLTANQPVAIRALFIEDPANSLNPPFFAAKVRQQ
ncbi:MAG TPA: hypothetical protein VMI32_00110 [Candidatus Solibacter sp.]|nr:hypothetical protein [Candidatus Solibacter sp.]